MAALKTDWAAPDTGLELSPGPCRRTTNHPAPIRCDHCPMRDEVYYKERLAAERLQQCYQLATPRVKQYLRAEVEFVVARLRRDDIVPDLGCGYGRTTPAFARFARLTVGTDNSLASLRLARLQLGDANNRRLVCADARRLAFASASFDRVVRIENGISAFHVDRRVLVRGVVVGEIDRTATRDGVIVCKDGFTAGTVHEDEFRTLVAHLDVELQSFEVDNSSVFFLLRV